VSVLILEAENIHRTDRNADPATNARTGLVIQHLLFETIAHYINTNLTIARAFIASYALVVGGDLELAPLNAGKEI